MIRNFKEWRESLSVTNQLFVSFILNIAYWLSVPFLANLLLWHRDRPIEYFAFGAVFMAFFWTVFFNWTKIKGLLSGNKA